ncbi:MAG TPA: hypothetical protein HPP77_07035 [Candidatus Hydrogenedentes bacterium]|nr:hypothetical protein [Candidatus Hydrogenedentota bacterium]
MKTRNRMVLLGVCGAFLLAIGAAPRYLEELCIGGGYGDSADGGADFEQDGDIRTDGDVSADGAVCAGSGSGFELTLTDNRVAFYESGADSGQKRVAQKYQAGASEDASAWSLYALTDAAAFLRTMILVDRLGNVDVAGDLDLAGVLETGTGSTVITNADGTVKGSAIDIAGTEAMPGNLDADVDKLLVSDNGTNKSITIESLFKVWQIFELTPGGGVDDDTNPPEYAEWDADPTIRPVLKFAGDTANEKSQWTFVLPSDYVAETDIKVRVAWTCQTGGAAGDNVRWHVRAVAAGDDDVLDAAFGTAVNLDDVWIADGDQHMTAEATLTIGGMPQALDLVTFEIERDYDYAGGGNAMDVDASLLGLFGKYQAKLEVVE